MRIYRNTLHRLGDEEIRLNTHTTLCSHNSFKNWNNEQIEQKNKQNIMFLSLSLIIDQFTVIFNIKLEILCNVNVDMVWVINTETSQHMLIKPFLKFKLTLQRGDSMLWYWALYKNATLMPIKGSLPKFFKKKRILKRGPRPKS